MRRCGVGSERLKVWRPCSLGMAFPCLSLMLFHVHASFFVLPCPFCTWHRICSVFLQFCTTTFFSHHFTLTQRCLAILAASRPVSPHSFVTVPPSPAQA
ncbi:hypothetical protein BDZ97DRAFT_1825139 [Flammula alnicola]|nr:hypothetical protein BDZ97DRAFT_1825139 [Flammula alnicola]